MGRPRNPQRDLSLERYVENDGKISTAELAKLAGVPESRIRKWKSEDKWDEALENKPKKKGGQKGNQNAKGHGAPPRNKNAETHGAYSTVYFEELTEEEKTLIESVTLDTEDNMLRELQTLIAKENDLKKRINSLNNDDTGQLYTDKVVEMRTPKKADNEDGDPYEEYAGGEGEGKKPALDVAMETTIKSSAFERVMKLEAELNKIHGRIIKLLDSIKSYELEQRRISLEEKRYALMKQKLKGEYEVDPDTGEIDDTYTEDEEGLSDIE